MSELKTIPLDVFYDGSFRQITGMNRSLGYIVPTLKPANGTEGPNSCILLFQFRNALLSPPPHPFLPVHPPHLTLPTTLPATELCQSLSIPLLIAPTPHRHLGSLINSN